MSQQNKTVNIMKGLIIDGVGRANSGHPGGAMSSADFAYVLYSKFLNYDPGNPVWYNRDRFVLSAGHESMLLYSLLVMQGFMPLDQLKQFRQWGSHTPGHPEVDRKHGIECTTGPLGQGFAMSVGMAAAEAHLQAQLGTEIVDHYTYVIAGDGDLQEPVALGAAQLAGHYKLGKLIAFYDKNQIQISGNITRADSTDIPAMFKSFGWHTIEIDGHDHEAITKAIESGRSETDHPTLIIGTTTMAKGAATMEGSPGAHGAPFSAEEIKATKEKLGLPGDQDFYLPQEALDDFRQRFDDMKKMASDWSQKLSQRKNEDTFQSLWQAMNNESYTNLDMPEFETGSSVATRSAFGKILEELADQIPSLAGGSADLEPSNNTAGFYKKTGDFTADNRKGRNFAFGVREFPMATLINGMALHGGMRTFGATFLVFADYEKAAMRLSALMQVPVLHVFTHDSFYLGEDGPTHQPIEQLASIRSLPNMLTLRPADASETAIAMKIAMAQKDRPSTLVLTRQKLPTLDKSLVKDAIKGGYVIKDSDGEPDLILIASGSEVHLALATAENLSGINTRVVSMMSTELFDEQPQDYRDNILPPQMTKRVTIEAASVFGWHRYAGLEGLTIGIDRFGASAPAGELEKQFNFTPEAVTEKIKSHFKL